MSSFLSLIASAVGRRPRAATLATLFAVAAVIAGAVAVGARRVQLNREIELVIATALEAELGPDERLAARLAAASLVATLSTIEETAAARMEQEGHGLTAAEIDRLLDGALAFVHAGVAALAPG